MNNFNFGENLLIIRRSKCISQEAMALNLQISQATYSRIERQSAIPEHQVAEIARILGVSKEELLPLDQQSIQLSKPDAIVTRQPEVSVFRSPAGIILKLSALAVLADTVYALAKGFCDSVGTSSETMLFVSWTATLVTVAAIFRYERILIKSG